MRDVINMEFIDQLKAVDEDGSNSTLIELVQMYFKAFDVKSKSMIDSFNGGDLATMKKDAHYLRSSSMNLGAEHLAKILNKIEYEEVGPSVFDDLLNEYKLVKTALSEITSAK